MSSLAHAGSSAEGSPVQVELGLPLVPLLPVGAKLHALDLFAGIGGFSSGFAEMGFSMVGVDSEPATGWVYEDAGFGRACLRDLGTNPMIIDVPVIIGGPPCRPWSAVNLQKRRMAHEDYGLFTRFIEHIRKIRPRIFVMENVPALKGDTEYVRGVNELRMHGYDVRSQLLHYERFGAATRRRRLFTVGVHAMPSGAQSFFRLLEAQHAPALTVRSAISRFRDLDRGEFPDHDWPRLRTIHKYKERYDSGRYGWRKLNYDLPAPSFGSVAKTYILHPEAGIGTFPERVLSVREVMAIMGFPDHVRFADGTARGKRYQMIANTVSPQVSRAIASTVLKMLTGGTPFPR